MQESIKIQSVPADRIHSNMLVLTPIEREAAATPPATTAGTGEAGGTSTGGGSTGGMGGY